MRLFIDTGRKRNKNIPPYKYDRSVYYDGITMLIDIITVLLIIVTIPIALILGFFFPAIWSMAHSNVYIRHQLPSGESYRTRI